MKIAVLIARLLLGLEFLIFGLNGFLHFIPMPPPSGLAGQFVPLALVLLGPILVNVLEFHLLVAPAGLPLAVFTLVLWLVVFSGVRRAFSGIFASKVTA